MDSKTFAISIGGKGVSPSTLRLRDLYEILHAFEAAISFTAAQGGGQYETDFHLVGIKEGNSADCTIAIANPAYGAAVRCAAAVANRNLSELPERARDSLLSIRSKARARNWHIRFSDGEGMPTAEIAADTDFITDSVLSGPSSIAGQLLRVGGAPKPTANLLLLDGRRLTAAIANKELAARLGEKLYHVISVDGEARWTSADWSLIDFKITGIGEFEATERITHVMDDLASIAGDFWDEIDPDEYIASIRAESD
ncbi:MAG TPA: hypothetical protein VND64_24620 [Pirellulales bacterium]|nr:hypothetical protein [Pirellulales bacterium]